MAKKIFLRDLSGAEVLPITRGELVLDSSGNPAFHSNEFLATESQPGLMSAEDKKRIDDLENTGPGADNKVAQVNTTTSDVYRLLFSETATDETKTEGARKSAKLTFNPSTGVLQTTALIGNLDGTYVNKLTGYTKATTVAGITSEDSLSTALGKLELKADATYDLVKGAYDGDGTIENLTEILKVLEGISDTETIQAIVGKYLPLSGGTMNNDSVVKFTTYGNRFLTVSGNSLDFDYSTCTGGWAGGLFLKDSKGIEHSILRWDGGTEGLKYTSFNGGNVGIGTTNPQYKLDVNGSGRFGHILLNKGYGSNVGDSTIEMDSAGATLWMQYYHNGGINMCAGGGSVTMGGALSVKGAVTMENTFTAVWGTINGELKFGSNLYNGAQTRIFRNASSVADYGTLIVNAWSGGDTRLLLNQNGLYFRDKNSTENILIHSGNYNSYALPLSGGELTGALSIKCGSDRKLILDNNDGEKWSLISFREKGEEYGYLGVTGSSDLNWNGAAVLHSANYNFYAPTLTGGGASGTWGINISGSASIASKVAVVACSSTSNSKLWDDPVVDAQKVKFWDVYNDGGPSTYGNIIEINGINGHWKPQLWFDAGANTRVRVRNRNYSSTENVWGAWNSLAFTSDIPTSLKNPSAIKFKNTSGVEVSYDGSAVVDLTGGVNYASIANLLNTVTISESDFNKSPRSGFYNVTKASTTTLPGTVTSGNIAIHACWDNGTNTAALDLLINDSTSSKLYYRASVGGQKGSWKQLATTSDIPTVTNYYWADQLITNSAKSDTNPTFASVTATDRIKANSYIFLNPNGSGIYLNSTSINWHVGSGYQKTLLSFTADGNVGVGATAPSSKLHIAGNIYSSGLYLNVGAQIAQYESSRTEFALINTNDSPSMLELGNNSSRKWGIEARGSERNYDFSIYNWDSADHQFVITHDDGKVGIGTTSPSEKLSVNGAIYTMQPSTNRRAGIIGTYDPNRAAAIWSMGSSYQIASDGTSFGSLYGAAYAYFGSGYTFTGYSGGHSFVWAQGGTPTAALGNNIWTSGVLETGSYLTFGYTGASFTSDIRSTWRQSLYGNTTNYSRFRTVRTDVTIDNFSEIYGSGITWSTADTQGYLSVSYSSGKAFIGGGNSNKLNWSYQLLHSGNYTSYALPSEQVSQEQNTDAYTWIRKYALTDGKLRSHVYNTHSLEWSYWIGMSTSKAYGSILRTSYGGGTPRIQVMGLSNGTWSSWREVVFSDNSVALVSLASSTDINTLTDNALYQSGTDSNTGTLANRPFDGSFMMLQALCYNDNAGDMRRPRIAVDGYGRAKLFNDRDTSGNGGTWYNILTDSNYSSYVDGRYLRWGGTNANVAAMTWGTLTTSNGYTILSHASSSDGGDMGFCNKSGQIFMQLDGYYYQNEGKYRVTDVSETVTALGTSGNNLTWTKNGTTNNITVPYASSATTASTANMISHSTYYYNGNVMKNSTSADTIFGTSATANYLFPSFMESHPIFNNYADVINFTGYCKWGGTQLATEYNAINPRVAIRKYNQSRSNWGDWTELLSNKNGVRWGGYNTTFESGTPASAVKSRFTASYMPDGNLLTYNTAGDEYTILMTCRPDILHGSALKWGYPDRYLRILRFTNGSARTDDWEKIAAGYADSAGYATSAGSSTVWTRTWQRGNDFNLDLSLYHNQTRVFMVDSTTSNHPTGTSAGFMIAHSWDWGGGGALLYQDFDLDYGRLYTNSKQCDATSYTGWKKVAWTSDIPTSLPANGGNADTVDNVHLEWAGSQAASNTEWLAGWTANGTKIKAVKRADLSVNNLNRLSGGFSISSAGWYKLAYIKSTDARGSVRLALITTGGNYIPRYTELKVSNGWSTIVFNQNGKFDWISKYRYTTDSTYSYIEAYFTGACDITLYTFSGTGYVDDSYSGWQVYSTATAGSGTVAETYDHLTSSSLYTSGHFHTPSNAYAAHFYENSDATLKKNIKEILDSDNIPVIKEFDWKSDGTHSYGLIAQELEEQGYSELVSDNGSHKTVNYSAALSLIVGKLQNKIKELEAEIENLKLRA